MEKEATGLKMQKKFNEYELKLIEWLREFKNRENLNSNHLRVYRGLLRTHKHLLDEAFGKNKSKVWTLESCKEDALKYKTVSEWINNSTGYQAAHKKGWLKYCCRHMTVRKKAWDFDSCKKSALIYNSRSEWENKCSGSYGKALKMGWLKECCRHMTALWVQRSLEDCKKDALKHKTRTSWSRSSNKIYSYAVFKGWLDECCSHMSPSISAKKKVKCSNGIVYESITQAAEFLKLNTSKISNVCSGKRKSTGGYTFIYIEAEKTA